MDAGLIARVVVHIRTGRGPSVMLVGVAGAAYRSHWRQGGARRRTSRPSLRLYGPPYVRPLGGVFASEPSRAVGARLPASPGLLVESFERQDCERNRPCPPAS